MSKIQTGVGTAQPMNVSVETVARVLLPGNTGFVVVAYHNEAFRVRYIARSDAAWPAQVAAWVQDAPAGTHVYWGTTPRATEDQREAAVSEVPYLWADLDAKDFGGHKEQAWQALMAYAVTPSGILDSGHGYHAYWLLEEPVVISGPAIRADVRSRLRKLAQDVGGDATHDLSRLLRVPASMNWKNPADPVEALLVHWDPTRRYPLDLFPGPASLMDRESGDIAAVVFEDSDPVAWGDLSPHLQRLLEEPGTGDRSRHEYRVVAQLVDAGYTPGQIRQLLANAPCGAKYREKTQAGYGETYLAGIIARVRSQDVEPMPRLGLTERDGMYVVPRGRDKMWIPVSNFILQVEETLEGATTGYRCLMQWADRGPAIAGQPHGVGRWQAAAPCREPDGVARRDLCDP